jgi:hypothetical protein
MRRLSFLYRRVCYHQVAKYCWNVYYYKTVWPVFTSLVYVITDEYSEK